MSYSVYIGSPNDIDNSVEMGVFSKAEHAELFSILNSIDIKYSWLSEMQEYEEFVNFTSAEIKQLLDEIKQIKKNQALEENALLNCLITAGEEAVSKGFQVMCVGED